jgi:hypothetical protein
MDHTNWRGLDLTKTGWQKMVEFCTRKLVKERVHRSVKSSKSLIAHYQDSVKQQQHSTPESGPAITDSVISRDFYASEKNATTKATSA